MNDNDISVPSLRGHRPFVLFWFARIFSSLALQMQVVAVGWQVYELTSSPLDLGLVGLAQFIPAFALVLVAGHAADRYRRGPIVRLAQMVEGIAAAGMALGTAQGWLTRDLILAFVRTEQELLRKFSPLAAQLSRNGMIWIAWPKKSSSVATDLSFDNVQRTGLDAGLVDVKICAVDEIWSGLKFVYRLKDRVGR